MKAIMADYIIIHLREPNKKLLKLDVTFVECIIIKHFWGSNDEEIVYGTSFPARIDIICTLQ